MNDHSYALLSNLTLLKSEVILNDPTRAIQSGELNLSISAENLSHNNGIFCLDFIFKIQGKKEESVLFEISCKFEASLNIEGDVSIESKDEQENLASIAFLQAYPSIREYIADTLRRMNLLLPINSIPFAIDFNNCDVKMNH